VAGLVAASAGSDWTYGGSILTFAFPMILFIAVASALYVLYTKPHLVPGHRYQVNGRSVTATTDVRAPKAGPVAAGTEDGPAAAGDAEGE
jgi:hypothetical protein